MNRNGGYIGLVSLLITVAIIALVVWRTDLLNKLYGFQSDLSGNGSTENVIEQSQDIKQSALNAKAMLEHRNADILK